MSAPPQLATLAWRTAQAHGIAPDLFCAVIEQESAWNPWTIRYESGFLRRYVWPLFKRGSISMTEANARATSWGLGQVMGETARELGFNDTYLSALCDPETGLEYAARKLKAALVRCGGNESATLEAYNGGANADYASAVLARRPKYAKGGESPSL